ncbi:MAG: hypothetical protein ACR2LT_00315 [Pyrinomonadaceae bacterium]
MIFKLSVIVILGSLVSVMTCQKAIGQKRTKKKTGFISISDLNNRKVIGLLGYALGETVVIEGVVADENYRRRKADVGELLLRVQSVNGKQLKDEIIFQFRLFSGADIKNPAAGAGFKYTGYETGGFSGTPEKAFDFVPRMPTAGFYFATSFVVLRDENNRK